MYSVVISQITVINDNKQSNPVLATTFENKQISFIMLKTFVRVGRFG